MIFCLVSNFGGQFLNVRPNYFSLVMENIVISCVIKKYLNNVVAGSKNVEITPSIHPLFIFSFASWFKVLLRKFCCGLFLKFIYSEKATKFCEISTNYLSYVLPVK